MAGKPRLRHDGTGSAGACLPVTHTAFAHHRRSASAMASKPAPDGADGMPSACLFTGHGSRSRSSKVTAQRLRRFARLKRYRRSALRGLPRHYRLVPCHARQIGAFGAGGRRLRRLPICLSRQAPALVVRWSANRPSADGTYGAYLPTMTGAPSVPLLTARSWRQNTGTGKARYARPHRCLRPPPLTSLVSPLRCAHRLRRAPLRSFRVCLRSLRSLFAAT